VTFKRPKNLSRCFPAKGLAGLLWLEFRGQAADDLDRFDADANELADEPAHGASNLATRRKEGQIEISQENALRDGIGQVDSRSQ
jgi:hypothetical protein